METKNTIMWIAIGVLFVTTLFLTFKTSSITSATIQADNEKIDTRGWTENEIMNYEMHGTIPARTSRSAFVSNSNQMVGGC